MITNVWYSMREDFDYESPENILHLRTAYDRETVSAQFKQENFDGFDWTLVSCWYRTNTDAEVEAAVNALQADNPDQVRVLQSYYVNTGYPMGTQDPDTGAFTYQPPLYPQYANLLAYMPDVGGLPATDLADVNLLFGQEPRELNFLTTLTPIVVSVWEAFPGFWLLAWNALTGPLDGYRIDRNGEPFGFTAGTVFVTTQPGDYVVRAVFDGKQSVPSNIVTIT